MQSAWSNDQIRELLARGEPCFGSKCGDIDPGSCMCAAAASRIAELERDAARYQYLRSRDLDTIDKGGVFAGRVPHNVVINGDDLDAAVDAAMG